MTTPLWCSNGGRVTCREHGGGYFTTHLAAHPNARAFTTPLDRWEMVTMVDREYWLAEMGEPMKCETCPTPTSEGATVNTRIPKRFYDDHVSRDLPAGTITKTTAKHYQVDLTEQEFDELLSDAQHYVRLGAGGDLDPEYRGLVTSARATVTALMKRLTDSEAYMDNAEKATEMWDADFRPIHAEDLKPDMIVVYRETDVFRMTTVGPFRYGRVEEVKVNDHGEVEVMHTGCQRGDPAISDDWAEVWAKVVAPGEQSARCRSDWSVVR